MAIAETAAALSSIKAAYDIAKGVHSLQTTTEVKQAIADILDQLVAARTEALEATEKEAALLQQIRDLEAEIDRLKAWDGERERYELKLFRPGSLAYVLKPSMDNGEPPHRLCAHCYQQGKKSILQATSKSEMRYRICHCPSCKTDLPFGEEMPRGAEQDPPQSPSPSFRSVRIERG